MSFILICRQGLRPNAGHTYPKFKRVPPPPPSPLRALYKTPNKNMSVCLSVCLPVCLGLASMYSSTWLYYEVYQNVEH